MRNPTIHDCRLGDSIIDHGCGARALVVEATHDRVCARYPSGGIVSWYATSLRMGTDIELVTDDRTLPMVPAVKTSVRRGAEVR